MTPADETTRLAALDSYDILDTPAEAGFDDLVLLASRACATPVALVSFVGVDRQWFKARVGFDACETPLDQSVCRHVVDERRLLVIPDLTRDPRTAANTLVTQDPFIRFYAGAPLIADSGDALGALCVIDTEPRPGGLTASQEEMLLALARQVMSQIELRRALRRVSAQEAALTALNAQIGKRVEETVQERDRLWRNSLDILLTMDASGIFHSVSPAVTAILGWKPEEMIGRTVMDFVIPDDRALTTDALATATHEELPVTENRFRHKDGGHRWISWVAAPEGGLIFATGRHITAAREQAALLAKAEDALRQSQKMEAVGQLTGGIAHDFNNLLTGISGSLERMQVRIAQGRIGEVGRYVNAALGASQRAAALTHRLLAFSRRQTLDPRPVAVNRLIGEIEEMIRRAVGPEIEVEVVGAGGLWLTLADANQLENALLNLCINARDAMPDSGRLTIETANKWLDDRAARERDLPAGQYISICVTDTGTGMSQDVIEHAFEPFFTTKPLGVGTGLGLSMIYGFARQSGGQVRIYSEVGQGTTMCIYLPRYVGEVDSAPEEALLSAAAEAQPGETVLVVDDEPLVRMLVVEVLEEAGFKALAAEDGATGLTLLRSDARIDLLITDVGLPGGMNGRQLADAARVGRPDLKVLFVTGYAENAVVGNGHLDPHMSILTKPFAIAALGEKISEIMGPRG